MGGPINDIADFQLPIADLISRCPADSDVRRLYLNFG
jgi:hypothetical protein